MYANLPSKILCGLVRLKALKDSLDGNPQGPDAELIGDREYLIDADKGFSRHYAKKKWYSSPMETAS